MPVPLPAALAPGLSDHVCHAYDGSAELRGRLDPTSPTGIALGQRPLVVAPERGSCRSLGRSPRRRSRTVRETSVDVVELGPPGGLDAEVDMSRPCRRWSRLTARLDAGVRGSARRRAAHPHRDGAVPPAGLGGLGAHLGQWQSLRPVASACSFDRGVLGDKAVQEMACLHPRVLTTGPLVPFRLYFRGGQLVLEGEVDSFSAPLLTQALAHVEPPPGERLMIDARGPDLPQPPRAHGARPGPRPAARAASPCSVARRWWTGCARGSASARTCSTCSPAPGEMFILDPGAPVTLTR